MASTASLLATVGQVDAAPDAAVEIVLRSFRTVHANGLIPSDAFEYRLTTRHVVTIYQLLDDATRFDVGTYAYAREENSADAQPCSNRPSTSTMHPQEVLSNNSSTFNQLLAWQDRVGGDFSGCKVHNADQWTAEANRPHKKKTNSSHQTLTRFLKANPSASFVQLNTRIAIYREHSNARRLHQTLNQATPKTAWNLLAHTPATQPIPMVEIKAKAAEYRDRSRIHLNDHADSNLAILKTGQILDDDPNLADGPDRGGHQSLRKVTHNNR